MAGRTVVGEFGSAELTDALPFLGKFRSRFTYCPNAASDNPHAPALLLCSWNFATQRQVDKYVRWYFERGFGCVLVMRPTAYHTYAFDPQKHLAPALLRFVEWAKVIQRRRRMVMHFFSGSCYLYIRMLKVLRDDFEEDIGQGQYGLPVAGESYAHIAQHIDGVVFDSTPIENKAANGANALAEVPGVPSLLWPLWWGALATWWYVLAGYFYPAEDRNVRHIIYTHAHTRACVFDWRLTHRFSELARLRSQSPGVHMPALLSLCLPCAVLSPHVERSLPQPRGPLPCVRNPKPQKPTQHNASSLLGLNRLAIVGRSDAH